MITASVVIGLAAYAALGWAAEAAGLQIPISGLVPLAPSTALLLIAAASAIVFRVRSGETARSGLVLAASGIAITIIAGYGMSVYVFGHANLADEVFAASSGQGSPRFGFRMQPQSAFNFLLIGPSLLLIGMGGRWQYLAAHLARAAAFFTFAIVVGVLYKSPALGDLAGDGRAAAWVAAFFLLVCSALAINRQNELLEVFLSDSLGGSAARRLLPVVVLGPLVIGWGRVLGQDIGLFSNGSGMMGSVYLIVLLMFSMVTFYSRKVHYSDLERQKALKEIEGKENRYRDLFEYSQSILTTHDLEGRITSVNSAFIAATGFSDGEIIGRMYKDVMPAEYGAGFDAYLRRVANDGEAQGLVTIVGKNGKRRVWEYRNILIDEGGKEPYVLGSALDVTHHLKLQRQLETMSLTDDLTGLLNRRGFMTIGEQQLKLETHASTARGLALMFADMDGLKRINDTLGHDAGSDALQILADVIRSVVRSSDLVARWGGDEFVILTSGADEENVEAMRDRIEASLDEFNRTSGKPFKVACSIGMVPVNVGDGISLEEVIGRADEEMYAVKKRKRAAREQQAVAGPAEKFARRSVSV